MSLVAKRTKATFGGDKKEEETERVEITQEGGKPNRAAYDKEQNAIKAEIDALQAKMNTLRDKINSTSTKGGPDAEKKTKLRAELEEIRQKQAGLRASRQKTLDELKALQSTLTKKIQDLNGVRGKLPYKTTAEIDSRIAAIEKQIESGMLKLVEERRFLGEVSQLKRHRATVESFSTQQAAIDADKRRVDEIRASLDDPETRALNTRFGAVKAELNKLNAAADVISKSRDSLFDERTRLSAALDDAYARKKASVAAFRDANNAYYEKVNEDRKRRQERLRAERAAQDEERRKEQNERLLEEARAPAFARDIEDCENLINYLKERAGIAGVAGTGTTSAPATASVPGLGPLAPRKIDSALPAGAVSLKKKTEEDYFAAAVVPKKNKKGSKPSADASETPLHLPFGILSALLKLGIPAPFNAAQLPVTIDSLELKMQYFKDNQDRVTQERVAEAQKTIEKADAKLASKVQELTVEDTPEKEES